jgi:hypothetical protein
MEVLDHYIHPTTSDLLGMIDAASLTIRAFSAQADSVALTPGSKSVEKIGLLPVPIPGRDSLELSDWKFDTRISQSSSHRYLLMQVSRWSLARKMAVIDMDDDDESELAITNKMEIPYIATLILEEAEGRGEYHRVGHAKIRDEHRGKILWQPQELVLI